MMFLTSHLIKSRLNKRILFNHYRSLPKQTDQTDLIDFSSNDYLGLSRSPSFKNAVLKERESLLSKVNPFGSTGSRLLSGNTIYVEKLENKIAFFKGFKSGLIFSCGYMANLGLISSLASTKTIIIYDSHIHASTLDGLKLSRNTCYPFKHNDLCHLEKRLKCIPENFTAYVCIESLYSVDGSLAPLLEISTLCNKYFVGLIVDEAHANGVMGINGQGLIAENHLQEKVFAQISTFGKALGCFGAIVLCQPIVKDFLINFARTFIYTTALPIENLTAIKCAYETLPLLNNERLHLQKLYPLFKPIIGKKPFSPIIFIPIKGNSFAKNASSKLASGGFDVKALLSPTVKRGNEGLRISLHAFNTENEVISLVSLLKEIL